MSQGFRKVIALFSLMLCPTLGFAQDSEPNKRALISDFNGEEAVGVFHIYEANPLNMEQGVRVELVDEDALGKPGGKALKIDYDVDSWQRSQIVIWFTLAEKDFSSYDTLHLSLKGQGPGGFRGNLPVRFVDSGNRAAPYVLSGIKGDWKHFQIPLKRFPRIRDWSSVKEFEIVIDDINAIPKVGALLVDEIYVSKDKSR